MTHTVVTRFNRLVYCDLINRRFRCHIRILAASVRCGIGPSIHLLVAHLWVAHLHAAHFHACHLVVTRPMLKLTVWMMNGLGAAIALQRRPRTEAGCNHIAPGAKKQRAQNESYY